MANEGLTLVRDRWYTALTADVSAGATTLPVVTNTANGNVLPTPCIIMCGFEQMYATASTATTITVTRGFASTAAAHAKGATVGIARVAAHHNDLVGILGSGGTGVPRQIATASGTGASGVIEFSSIPATYRNLMLSIVGRTDAGAATTVLLTFETSPTAGAYNWIQTRANGTAMTVSTIDNTSSIQVASATGPSGTASAPGAAVVWLLEYANTGFFKTVIANDFAVTTISSTGLFNDVCTGIYEATAAIDRIRLTLGAGNWTTASRVALYGIPA